MKYEEARDEIKHLSNFLVTESEPFQNSSDWSQITICFDLGAFDTLGLAVEALEKQIPKKPAHDEYCDYCCPSCGDTWNANEYGSAMQYCWTCGQRIDWSEVKE